MEQPTPPTPSWPQPTPPQRPTPQPSPRRGMGAGAKWAIGCAVALALVVIAFIIMIVAAVVAGLGSLGAAGQYPSMAGGNVALVRVEGAITAGGADGGPFGAAGAASERIIDQLHRAAEDSAAKAVLVRIDSPGGSAAGAQEIYQEIRRVRQRKPVYVSMGDVAASGGYYVAAAADRIYANPGTITGSIGVISATLDLSELLKKIGIGSQVVKTGKFKDMGSGMRPMTPEELQLTRQLLDSIYQQFVSAVAEGRKLPRARVLQLADGRVYTGEQALKLKLVDELGSGREALRAVGKRAGVRGEPKAVEYRKRGVLEVLFGDVTAPAPPRMRGILYDRLADLVAHGTVESEEVPLR